MRRQLENQERRSRGRPLGVRAATTTLVAIAALVAVGAASAGPGIAPDSTRALAGMWHRLNPQQSQSNPAPEHETMTCHRRTDNQALPWDCRYSKIPEPDLNFAWNTTTGRFAGADVTSSWACPGWFPPSVCGNVVHVAEGNFVFYPAAGGSFTAFLDLVVAQIGGEQTLYAYWVDSFACPWFRSFDEALAANPFPLPFDGVNGPAGDCAVAP